MIDETVLITGGAGFIGTHTSRALLELGCRVRILDNFDRQVHGDLDIASDSILPGVDVVVGDVRDPDAVDRALDGVNRVLHLASLTGVGQSMYDMRSYTDVNVSGTGNLLERILRSNRMPDRVVLASSRAVYGEGSFACDSCGVVHPPGRDRAALERAVFEIFCPTCGEHLSTIGTPEQRPLNPISYYGWTKRCQEEQVSYAAATFGLPATILRYFNVYGSGQSLVNPYTGIVSIFYSRLVGGAAIDVYERGVPLRDFVHVSDVVRANVAALNAGLEPGSTINVGTGSPCSVQELAEGLAAVLGRASHLEITERFRVGDIHSCIADDTRLRDELGIVADTALHDGLVEFADWARQQTTRDAYEDMVSELESFGLFGGSAEPTS